VRRIYKYALNVADEQDLMLRGRVLSAGVQDGAIMVWAVHDDDVPAYRVQISVRGTGHPLGSVNESDFVGTVFMGPYVWHIFAKVPVSR
jgi:hypothetical protein